MEVHTEVPMKKILAFMFAFMFAFGARAGGLDDVKSWAQNMIEKTVTEIFVDGATHGERVKSFRRAIADNFDFAYIAKFVLGVYGRGADEAQRGRFIASFTELNVYSYVKKFDAYNGQKVEVTGASAAKKAGEFFVDSKAIAGDASQKDVAIAWRLVESGGAYKVVDVIIEGVSMAMSYKNEYAPILKAAADEGKDPVDELVSKIDAKVAALKDEK
jgi:phospholipid transport system substrate-binding protein